MVFSKTLLADLHDTEREAAQLRHDAQPEGHIGFLPYPIPAFISLLAEAVMEAPGPRFLDVGCGPGTKPRLAQALFGLDATGIEIVPELVKLGLARGCPVTQQDAFTYPGYGNFDLVFHNQPWRGMTLARLIWEAMKPGAVMIMVNAPGRPPEDWDIVIEEVGSFPVNGAWQKPVPLRPSNPATQAAWGRGYIHRTYGNHR